MALPECPCKGRGETVFVLVNNDKTKTKLKYLLTVIIDWLYWDVE